MTAAKAMILAGLRLSLDCVAVCWFWRGHESRAILTLAVTRPGLLRTGERILEEAHRMKEEQLYDVPYWTLYWDHRALQSLR
jgi:hypothetical protein